MSGPSKAKRKSSYIEEPLGLPENVVPRRCCINPCSILVRHSRLMFILSLLTSLLLTFRPPRCDQRQHDRLLSEIGMPKDQPSFWKQHRGLVIFYHIPKTGGTFVRDTLSSAHIPVERVFSTKQLLGNKYGDRIRSILTGQHEELLVLELHGRSVGIPDLPIREWRDIAAVHGVPFFAFTLLRDPVAFHDSYFSFFHRTGCQHRWCEPIIYDEMNESNLLDSLVPNKQCELLYHGQLELKWNITEDRTVSEKQCRTIEKLLKDDWDWVGTTEHVSDQTIPMLFELILNQSPPNDAGFSRRHKVVQSQETVTAIRERSWMDERLYAACS